MKAEDIKELSLKIKENINKVIVGKEKIIDVILTSIICGGHVFMEDVPGAGKTMLAKALQNQLAEISKECSLQRICCLQI